jgi:site-specific recombinase XerD
LHGVHCLFFCDLPLLSPTPVAGTLADPVEIVTHAGKDGHRMFQSPCELIFPTNSGNPQHNFLTVLKAVAKRAELDPGDCWLHKFRATFAKWHLWSGVDLRTVQQWLGHSDLESTMRYLKPSREEKVRLKVNETFA